MKPTLQPGLAAETTISIDRERTIDFMGEAARVYATPMLVRDIEMTCRELLLEHLDAGEDSVGTRVEIDHIGATLLGMTVTLAVRVAELNGRAVVFEVEGRDAIVERLDIVLDREAAFAEGGMEGSQAQGVGLHPAILPGETRAANPIVQARAWRRASRPAWATISSSLALTPETLIPPTSCPSNSMGSPP